MLLTNLLTSILKNHKKITLMKNAKGDKKEAGKIYTCSRHPEVRSDKPGKCPKCGMVTRIFLSSNILPDYDYKKFSKV